MNKKFLLLIVIVLLLVGCGKKEEAKIESGKITCAQMKTLMKGDNNPRLYDVRTAEEYKEGHLDKAENIPYENIVSVLDGQDDVGFETPIIVYCKSGNRSGQAYNSLKVAGYKNVYDLGAMSSCK